MKYILQPNLLARLNVKVILPVTILLSIFSSIFVVFEFETICHGQESAHENLLGVCPEGEKAYLVFSDLRLVKKRVVDGEFFSLFQIPLWLQIIIYTLDAVV
jgi:hypothetical protein